jgi:hypothetical protein
MDSILALGGGGTPGLGQCTTRITAGDLVRSHLILQNGAFPAWRPCSTRCRTTTAPCDR